MKSRNVIGQGKAGPGRPKMTPEQRLQTRIDAHVMKEARAVVGDGQRLATAYAPAAIAKIKEIMDTAESPALALEAADRLLDRAYGPARNASPVNLTQLNVNSLPPDAATAVIARALEILQGPSLATADPNPRIIPANSDGQ